METMRALQIARAGAPLALEQISRPDPGPGELRLRVAACGVCRTDLHLLDGELPDAAEPIVPGHQIVGRVDAVGAGVREFALGDRVGVPWLGGTCGTCRFCTSGRENLCDAAVFTGYRRDGGYAEYAVADARFCVPISDRIGDVAAAPLLCAGAIGYRCLRMAGDAAKLGLYGFGAAAHVAIQVALHERRRVFAFTRPGDLDAQRFARELGAEWAGPSDAAPPELLDAAILFAPVGALVPAALRALDKGGAVICGGIHMSDIPAFPYRILWEERVVRSVANLTRRDAREFLALAPQIPIRTHTEVFALEDGAMAIARLRAGALRGSAVLVP
ncbi:MAG TPA: zinc-dependent alcohol dehydrogenase family protein [Myxococcota bacterium]|nr:zinc-dependent alcohol dehydrogenase family protein [Myxococcota bacterium]